MTVWFGAAFDTAYMLWFWIPGVVWALAMGFRNWIDMLGLGFMVSTLTANLLFLATYALGQPEAFVGALRWVTALSLLASLLVVKRDALQLVIPVGAALALSSVGAIARNVFRLDGWLGEYDHVFTAFSSQLIQAGQLTDRVIDEAVYKKGLAFPVIMALGRDGLLLGSTPIVIFGLLIVVTYRLAQLVAPDKKQWLITTSWATVMVMWMSAQMFWGLPFYQHGHVMLALASGVCLLLVMHFAEQPVVSWPMTAALAITSAVVTQSRFEAFVLAFFLTVPVLWSMRAKTSSWRGQFHSIAVSLAWPFSFSLWVVTLGNFPVDGVSVPLIVFLACAGALIAATVLYWLPVLRNVLIHLSWMVLLVLTTAYLLYARPGGLDWVAFSANTFEGEGAWGGFWWMPLAAVILLLVIRKTPQERLVFWLTVIFLLVTVLIKATDGITDERFGTIRIGWGDSVNRSLFHSFAPVTTLLVIALSRTIHAIVEVVGPRKVGRRSIPART